MCDLTKRTRIGRDGEAHKLRFWLDDAEVRGRGCTPAGEQSSEGESSDEVPGPVTETRQTIVRLRRRNAAPRRYRSPARAITLVAAAAAAAFTQTDRARPQLDAHGVAR